MPGSRQDARQDARQDGVTLAESADSNFQSWRLSCAAAWTFFRNI